MPTYDFSWTREKTKRHRTHFEHSVAIAKQIAYDIGHSIPAPGDQVIRNRDLVETRSRIERGLQLATVVLVSELDVVLNSGFEHLWTGRRDILADWIREQLPRLRNEAGKEVRVLAVEVDDIWKPDVLNTPIRDYFEDFIRDRWESKRVKNKLDKLIELLSIQIAKSAFDKLESGLMIRNEFVHPKPWNSRRARSSKSKRITINEAWFGDICTAFADIVEALNLGIEKATHRTITTNITNLTTYLSERQRVAFYVEVRKAADQYGTLKALLGLINQQVANDVRIPEVFVFEMSQEFMAQFADLLELHTTYPTIPIIIYEDAWGMGPRQGQEALIEQFQAFASSSANTKYVVRVTGRGEEYDPKYDPLKELRAAIKGFTGVS